MAIDHVMALALKMGMGLSDLFLLTYPMFIDLCRVYRRKPDEAVEIATQADFDRF